MKLLTDNGSNLTASPLTSLCNRLHIHRLYITPYHHSANGVVEKFNGTIVQMLAPTINGDIGRWDEDVPAMVFAYNCAVNSATGHTPYEAFFGRQPVLPIENMLLPFVPNDIDVDTYGDVVREHAQRVHSRILQATQESRAMRSAQAANTPAHSYEVHDRVYILRRRKPDYTPAKLIARWVGPFQVTRMLNPVTAKLRGRNGELPRAFHASRLKPCYDMNSPRHPVKRSCSTNSDPTPTSKATPLRPTQLGMRRTPNIYLPQKTTRVLRVWDRPKHRR